MSVRTDEPAYPSQEGKPYIYINDLYSSSSWRTQYRGIGTRLLQCAQKKSVREGYDGRVVIQSAPAAFLFYERFGFRPFGSEDDLASAHETREEVKRLREQGVSDIDLNRLFWPYLYLPARKSKVAVSQ